MYGYPVFPVGRVFREAKVTRPVELCHELVRVDFPVRINTVVLDQTKVAPNEDMIFPAGEILLSVNRFIHVIVQKKQGEDGEVSIEGACSRIALIRHACILMMKALNISPNLQVYVDDSKIMKHSGLGSSGALLGGVCAAINEMYGCPIGERDLIRYIAGNYGEEVENQNIEELQCNPCFGGSIATGMIPGSVQIISGFATSVFSGHFTGRLVLGIPENYKPMGASEEIEKHAEYLFGEKARASQPSPIQTMTYNYKMAYRVLHQVMPALANGDISELGRISFEFNFQNENRSVNDTEWLFTGGREIGEKIAPLYLDKQCISLGLSSVGPTFYALVEDKAQEEACITSFSKAGLTVSSAELYNGTYQVQYD